MFRSSFAILAATAVLVLAAVGSASAAPLWRNVTGDTNTNLTAVATVRAGSTGALHVIWAGPTADDRNASKALYAREVLASGALGPIRTLATSTSAGSFSAPAVARNPIDGTFWFFSSVADQFEGKLIAAQSADATATIGAWNPISTDGYAYASFGLGAAFASDGTAYQTWRSMFKRTLALDPAEESFTEAPGISSNLTGCCVYWAHVAVEAGTNKPYIAYYSNATDRSGLELIDVTSGATTYVPGSASPDRNSSENSDTVQLVSRVGAPGMYVGYCSVGPFCKSALVWKAGTAKPMKVGAGSDVQDVSLSAAPGGRLWVSWRNGAYMYARRSNTTATAWGAIVARKLPGNDASVYRMSADGSAGYLDAFAHLDVAGYSTWTMRVLPGLTVAAVKSTKIGAKLVVKVTDAGVAVPGAAVKFRGMSAKTNALGVATFTVAGKKGVAKVTATRGGFDAGSATASVHA